MASATHQESALIVEVPEAEALVHSYRLEHDSSARRGIPAHITLLYPFIPPSAITPEHLEALRNLFSEKTVFPATLVGIRRFPDVLYLHPSPSENFKDLTASLVKRFPAYPPYGGIHPNTVPHLTVAKIDDREKFEEVAQQFTHTAQGYLPVRFKVFQASLFQEKADRWERTDSFHLKQ